MNLGQRQDSFNSINSRDITRVSIARYIQNFFIAGMISFFMSVIFLVFYVSYSSNLTQNDLLNIKTVFFNTSNVVQIQEEFKYEEAKKLYITLKTFESEGKFAGEILSKKTLENGNVILNLKLKKEFAEAYFYNKVTNSVLTIFLVFIVVFALTLVINIKVIAKLSSKYAKNKLANDHVGGSKMVTEEEYIEIQKQNKITEGAPIGHKGVVFNNRWINYHTFIVGATGAGKTLLLGRDYVYNKAKYKNFKAIIHDRKGDWISRYYDPKQDFILNFFDKRGFDLEVFTMIKEVRDIFGVVQSIVPPNPSSKDPTWDNTAKDILTGILFACLANGTKTNRAVKDFINLPKVKIVKQLQITRKKARENLEGEAQDTVVDGINQALNAIEADTTNAESFTQNLKSRATFFTMQPNKKSGREVNLNEWIDNDKQSTIFLLNDVKASSFNAIVIAAFIDYFSRSLLTKVSNDDFEKEHGFRRKIHLYVDEAGSLQKINSIKDLFTLARSYGCHINFGIQDFAQAEEIYGKNTFEAILNSCSSKIILRANSVGGDITTAKKSAELVGQTQYMTTEESFSAGTEIGANREGVSLARKKVTEALVQPSDIVNLNENEYIVQIGNGEWTHIKTRPIKEIDNFHAGNAPFEEMESLTLDKMTIVEKKNEDQEIQDLVNEYEEEKFNESVKGNGEENSNSEDSLKDIRGSDFI
ncbi:type IV secretory system conjugative DNA transfer family protein [Aliarcobacter butzleri]|uniref:type IV secretory system conjugative DNA transfer family protein n=1 Tax=Aliarcobacter butzleri TaxID=28197 RepID=UPI0021B43A1C|nr:type IV secretion system DNA-binding domain-containing protein [Aliarcobacter butzleri]MCT7596112.1 type IV secretion system DNA-binding domain-containing protein [Aliarcobacter butzleri]